ncbi:MAG: pyridoxamine 5'-phosphate oxidase family protein [Candidatus Omnitrophica bacterium]|nr:pyridoxamine 5'-phosphate oxidase family protein [Candidatus Omnitrophota bacterium]MCF7894284.1 pyridoxamine 5'-phosphate oxidase family protein [Candidatus Omnitrophota bacterium]
MLTKEALNFLKGKSFINVATCGEGLRPNVAPKFLLKIENNYIYLIDYVRNTTLKNIEINSKVSISSINLDTLKGYQVNGLAEIIKKERKSIYKALLEEYEQKQIDLSTRRLIEALHDQKKSSNYEAEFPKRVAIIKIKVTEAVGISLQGNLERENF